MLCARQRLLSSPARGLHNAELFQLIHALRWCSPHTINWYSDISSLILGLFTNDLYALRVKGAPKHTLLAIYSPMPKFFSVPHNQHAHPHAFHPGNAPQSTANPTSTPAFSMGLSSNKPADSQPGISPYCSHLNASQRSAQPRTFQSSRLCHLVRLLGPAIDPSSGFANLHGSFLIESSRRFPQHLMAQQVNFLGLPPELRNMIYYYACQESTICLQPQTQSSSPSLRIQQTGGTEAS